MEDNPRKAALPRPAAGGEGGKCHAIHNVFNYCTMSLSIPHRGRMDVGGQRIRKLINT